MSQAAMRTAQTRAIPFSTFMPDVRAWGNALRQVLEPRYDLSFLGYSIWDAALALFVERVLLPRGAEPVHLGVDDLDDYGFGQAVRSGQPRLVTDLEREATRRGEWTSRLSFGTRSYPSIPLRANGRVVGAFGLGSPAIGHFSESDIEWLNPLMELFELVLAQRSIVLPPTFEQPSLIDGQPVVMIALDTSLSEAVAGDLPKDVEVRHAEDLEAAEGAGFAILWVICSAWLTRKLAQKLVRSLRKSPRRTLVLCREASPGTVHYLVTETDRFSLLAITSLDELVDRRLWLASWYFAGVVVPEWQALGVDRDNVSNVVGQVLMAIEQEPFRDWRVDELARRIGVSARTLRRALFEETGFHAKECLMAVRYQLVDRFRKGSRLKGEEMAELFGFASNKHTYDWCARYENNHATF